MILRSSSGIVYILTKTITDVKFLFPIIDIYVSLSSSKASLKRCSFGKKIFALARIESYNVHSRFTRLTKWFFFSYRFFSK